MTRSSFARAGDGHVAASQPPGLVLVLLVLLVAGCGSQVPFGVDPPLREAANLYAVALTQGDRASLAELGTSGNQGRLDAIVAAHGGHATVPWAYNSQDRGHAIVEFCQGTAAFWQIFLYQSGEWRPFFDTIDQTGGPIPAATMPAALMPPTAPEPTCS